MGLLNKEKRWIAKIMVNHKSIHLGTYDTIEEAAKARTNADERYKFHTNHGR